MRLEIYEGAPAPPAEEPVRLRLRANSDGSVRLIAVNAEGGRVDCGNLITIYPDGTMHRHGGVNNDLGFGNKIREES